MGGGGCGDGLEIGDAWAGDLGEVGAGAEHERAEDEVGEGEDHVEVLVHVAVVEDVVAVEEAEETSFFDAALLGEMHAPVHVFVDAVVGGCGDGTAEGDGPLAADPCDEDEGEGADEDEDGAVPPCHGDGFLVFFVLEVIGVVGLESLVVDDGVGVKCVSEAADGAVHDVFMEGPFEERIDDDAEGDADERPEEKGHEDVG